MSNQASLLHLAAVRMAMRLCSNRLAKLSTNPPLKLTWTCKRLRPHFSITCSGFHLHFLGARGIAKISWGSPYLWISAVLCNTSGQVWWSTAHAWEQCLVALMDPYWNGMAHACKGPNLDTCFSKTRIYWLFIVHMIFWHYLHNQLNIQMRLNPLTIH